MMSLWVRVDRQAAACAKKRILANARAHVKQPASHSHGLIDAAGCHQNASETGDLEEDGLRVAQGRDRRF